MDLQKALEYRNSRNLFCKQLGITVTELSLGYAKTVKEVTAEDVNPIGVAHGGLYFTMADAAAGSAMASYGHKAVTLNAQYSVFRSAQPGDTLTAVAREVKHGGTVCVYDIAIHDQNGVCVGTGTFTFFDLKEPLTIE